MALKVFFYLSQQKVEGGEKPKSKYFCHFNDSRIGTLMRENGFFHSEMLLFLGIQLNSNYFDFD